MSNKIKTIWRKMVYNKPEQIAIESKKKLYLTCVSKKFVIYTTSD